MSLRLVLVSAGLATVCGPLSIAGLMTSPTAASPGGDAAIVVASGTVDVAGGAHVLTSTTMCPAGTRATGGGAYPVSPRADGMIDTYRVNYTAPVDASGLASNTDAGDIPRGWQVTIGVLDADTSGSVRFFAICSTVPDATIAVNQPAMSGVQAVTASCPAGSRALGGGVGKTNDTLIPQGSSGPLIYQTGPVDGSGTVVGTQPGDVATGWRTIMAESGYGNRFFAVCSVASDAVVASAGFTLVKSDAGPEAGVGVASCPAGTRALSSGLAVDNDEEALQQHRVGFMAPGASLAEIGGATTGDASRSALAQGRASAYGSTTYRVFLICAADTPPPAPPRDTTPPDVSAGKGPAKKTTSTKATFSFSSEPGATFTCQLDKLPAVACTSPLKVKKLKPGRHRMTITAKDAAGNADPTPLIYQWKVKGKKHRPAAESRA